MIRLTLISLSLYCPGDTLRMDLFQCILLARALDANIAFQYVFLRLCLTLREPLKGDRIGKNFSIVFSSLLRK